MNNKESAKTIYSLSNLNDKLEELKNIVDSFDKSEVCLGSESQELIQSLTEKKGSFLGIKYSKTPEPNELLDVSRTIYNSTNHGFTQVHKQIKDLHEANKQIFTLFIILNQLSSMSQQRLVGAYSLIKNAQREIKENCKQTSVQGNQLKDMVLMHLQHIKKEKQFRFFNSITYKIIVGIMSLSALVCSLFL